ncbi:tetratricopeptide repeat protein [bacterium]|nr:tetratricopeptide repeat protein [bacterium]
MASRKTSKRQKTVRALIIIADIENSSLFAETSPPGGYNKMIREYHRIASRAVDEYSRFSIAREEAILYKKAYGDEVIILLKSSNIKEIVTYALDIAVLLEVEWSRSRFNTARINDNKEPFRLRIGIGLGRVTMAESVWGQGVTPEGYAIARTKRIEACAGAELNEPHILITGSLRDTVVGIDGIKLGGSQMIRPAKTTGTKPFEALRIKSYEGLYNEFKERIRTRDRYVRWFTLGIQAFSAGAYKEAYRSFKLAVKARPTGVIALTNLAGILIYMGKLDEAEENLRKVLKIKKDLPEALTNLGSLLDRKERIDEAEHAYRKALKYNPEYALAHYNLGNILFKQGRLDEAEMSYKSAIKLKPDYIAAYHNYTSIRENQERYNDALKLARKVLSINPHLKSSIELVKHFENLTKGEELVRLNRLDEAEQLYREMLNSQPDSSLAHYNLGNILVKRGEYAEAEEAFKAAIELNQNYIKALCGFALLMNRLGRKDEALDLVKRAVAINPNRKDVINLVNSITP